MNYEIQRNLSSEVTGPWDRRSSTIAGFKKPAVVARQATLFISFGLLLVLVVLGCTVSPSPFIVVALIAMLAIVALAVCRPRFALLLVFLGAGLPSLQLPLPGHNMHLVEPALLLCLLVIVIRRSSLQLRLPHLLALLFIAIAIVSFIHKPEISTNAKDIGADKTLITLILIFTAFFCGTFLAKYVKDASKFLVAVLLTNIPLYLIGLAQALGIHLSPLLEASGADDPKVSLGRLWGPFPWSVNFGMYLVNLFAIALACYLLGTRRRDRIIGVIIMITTALEIIGSGTRSVAISAIVVTIIMLIITRRFKTLFITIGLASVAIAVFFEKILPLFTHDAYSTSNRLFLWNEAIKLIVTNPWIGIGLSQFRFYYAQLVVSPIAELGRYGIHPHEQYLEWAMESGIAWLVVGALLLFSITYSCWLAFHKAEENIEGRRPASIDGQKALLMATILAVLANTVIGFFDAPLDQLESGVFLFLLAGLALGYAEFIRWGEPKKKIVTLISSPLLPMVQEVDTIGVINELYMPPLRKPWAETQVTPRPSSSNSAVAFDRDAAPNARKAGRSVVIQLLAWGIAVPIIFPTTALLTRYLGPIQYGEYSFALPFLIVFALLSGTGMDPLIIRQLSRQPRTEWSNILSYAAGTRLLSTALSSAGAALVAMMLPISIEQRNLLLIGSVSLFFSFSVNCLRMIYTHGFRAEQSVSILSLLETANRILTAGLVVLVVLLHLSLLWAYALIIYSDLPCFIILMLIARRRFGMRIRFNLNRVREHLLGSLSLTGYDLLVLFSGQADLILLMALAGPLSVGIYALASRVTDPLISIIYAYVLGLYPLLCTKFEEGYEQFNGVYYEAIRILALVIIPLAIFVSVEASMVVALLGGHQFAAAVIVVQLLMWAMAATFFNQLAARACMAANLDRRIPYVTGASVIINILLNLVLIPRWQFVGAGAAALSSELIALCLFNALLIRHVRVLRTLSVVLRVLLGNLPALAFLLWQQQAPLLLAGPLTLLLTIVGCIAIRVLSLNDVRMVQRFLFAKRGKSKESSRVDSTRSSTIRPQPQNIADWPTVILPRVQV